MGTPQGRNQGGTPLKRRGWEVNKHTPGPWIIRPIGGYPIIQSETGVLVAKTDCSLNSDNFVSDLNTARANADLIASAPTMLDALERCADWFKRKGTAESAGIACDVFQAIDAAKGNL